MTDEQTKLKEIVENAINSFNEKEKYLLENNLSERCICAKFASYIEKALLNTEYSTYIVDVEYNRGNKGSERSAKRLKDKNIIVDLIVHKRGYDNNYGFDNLICIEMKKSNDSRGKDGIEEDEKRLRRLVSYEYGFIYRIGFMIIADIKNKNLKIKDEPFYLP